MKTYEDTPIGISAAQLLRVLVASASMFSVLACERAKTASGDSAGPNGTASSAVRLDSLSFAQIPISYSTVTHIADAKGYFRDAGLVVSIVSAPAGPDIVTQLRNTTTNPVIGGTIAVTPVATMIGAGNEPVILATTVSSWTAAKLVTFAKSGITATPSSLRGKRLGVVNNTNGDIYLSRVLTKGGLKASDVKISNGRPADLVTLLVNGDVDAAVLWEPFISQTKRRYQAVLDSSRAPNRGAPMVFVDSTLHHLEFNVVTTRQQLTQRSAVLRKFLAACLKAEEFIHDHPAEARAETEKWLGLQNGDLEGFFSSSDFHVHLDTAGIQKRLGDELSWLHTKTPTLTVPVGFGPFVDGSLLRALDSTRVH